MTRFRKIVLTLGALTALLLAVAFPAAAQKHYSELEYPPLRDLQLPEVNRTVLPNGLVLYLVEDHTLPRVQGFALIRSGARFEPADKIGLASVVGQAMRTGGTESHPGEEIDRMLENVGASVETGVGTSTATASVFALKEDLPLVLEILADLLQSPAFPDDKIELAKVQQRTGIARRNDNVSQIAGREFAKLLYGAENPYARHTEYATIAAITRDDLIAFHQRYFHPNQTILGLWGDFDPAEAKGLVEEHFGSWPRVEADLPPLPEVPRAWQGSLNFIQKDDVNQTNLRIGHLGGRFDDEDFYALNIMAEILGGGFSSRLFRRIRSDLGLAYASFGTWAASYDHPGTFWIRVDTKSESTVLALREILKEVERVTQEEVTEEELRIAKDGILNSFVFNFDTTGEIVQRLMTYEYYDYPPDFLEKFKANIEKVTAEDVLRAAQKNVHPDQLVILAVGRAEDFDEPLNTLGKVNTIDITIPQPKMEEAAVPEATPEALERGRQVLLAAIDGLGGRETLEGIKDLSSLSEVTQVMPQGDMTINLKAVAVLPDKVRTDAVTPFGPFVMATDGSTGWMKTPQGSGPLPPAQVENLKKSLTRLPSVLLLSALDEERPVQFLETTEVDGSAADVIVVPDATGENIKLYVEQGSGHIIKRSLRAEVPGKGPVQQEQAFSDFREVSGLTMPFKEVTYHDGERAGERTVKNVEINTGVDPAIFAAEEEEPEG